jgi:hypothetical protein
MLVTCSQQRELDMEHNDNFAKDLTVATAHIEVAVPLLIKYRNRAGKPERVRLEQFMGSVSGIKMLVALLDVPPEMRV